MSLENLPESYLTLAAEGRGEVKVQRSRFLALAAPAAGEEEARAVIDAMARQYHDSRHVCHGWRLGHDPGTVENRNDAGEPGGTAGEPILAAIRKRGLVDVVTVVVRYFGGVKLGTGGLQRAYGQAAEEALSRAPVREVLLGRTFLVTFAYPFQKTMGHLLDGARGWVLAEEYSDRVTWRIWTPHSTWRQLEQNLTEASAGTVELVPVDDAEG
jgi:uncharacterized YigZ family protein